MNAARLARGLCALWIFAATMSAVCVWGAIRPKFRPSRTFGRARARYEAAQVNVLAAGALVAMLVDAYEALEISGLGPRTMRELCAQACDDEARLFEAYARAPGALPTDGAKGAQSRHLAELIRALA